MKQFIHFFPEVFFGGDRGENGWEEKGTAASEEVARKICFPVA